MPRKIKVLIGLMLLSIVLLTYNALLKDKFSPLIGPMLTLFLLFGVMGEEDIRSFLIFFGWLNIIYASCALLVVLIMMPTGLKQGAFVYYGLLFALSLGFFQSLFYVWCLKQEDVVHWMRRNQPKEALSI